MKLLKPKNSPSKIHSFLTKLQFTLNSKKLEIADNCTMGLSDPLFGMVKSCSAINVSSN